MEERSEHPECSGQPNYLNYPKFRIGPDLGVTPLSSLNPIAAIANIEPTPQEIPEQTEKPVQHSHHFRFFRIR